MTKFETEIKTAADKFKNNETLTRGELELARVHFQETRNSRMVKKINQILIDRLTKILAN